MFASYLKSALEVCDTFLDDCEDKVSEIEPSAWYYQQAVDAHRCMVAQIALLKGAKADESTLATIDTAITLADALNECSADQASMIISLSLRKAHELLRKELLLKRRAKHHKKHKLAA